MFGNKQLMFNNGLDGGELCVPLFLFCKEVAGKLP